MFVQLMGQSSEAGWNGRRRFIGGVLFVLAGCGSKAEISTCETSDPTAPRDNPRETYECIDAMFNDGAGCGEGGYPLGYAAKYAEIYMGEVYDEGSEAVQGFLDRNLICLQAALIEGVCPDMSCGQVADIGYQSHGPCYLESGVCDLSLTDMLNVLGAIDQEDLARTEVAEVFAEITEACWPS